MPDVVRTVHYRQANYHFTSKQWKSSCHLLAHVSVIRLQVVSVYVVLVNSQNFYGQQTNIMFMYMFLDMRECIEQMLATTHWKTVVPTDITLKDKSYRKTKPGQSKICVLIGLRNNHNVFRFIEQFSAVLLMDGQRSGRIEIWGHKYCGIHRMQQFIGIYYIIIHNVIWWLFILNNSHNSRLKITGDTDGPTDITSYRDATAHLKTDIRRVVAIC